MIAHGLLLMTSHDAPFHAVIHGGHVKLPCFLGCHHGLLTVESNRFTLHSILDGHDLAFLNVVSLKFSV